VKAKVRSVLMFSQVYNVCTVYHVFILPCRVRICAQVYHVFVLQCRVRNAQCASVLRG